MVSRPRLLRAATTAAFALALATSGAAATSAPDAPIYGLTTDNQLLMFTADAPDELLANVKIRGLRAG